MLTPRRTLALILIALSGLAFSPNTAGAQPVLFVGSSTNQAISAVPVDPEHIFVTTIGAGRATHLGKFTFVSPHLSGLADFSISGEQIFTAANGDELHATLEGNLQPVVDETGHVFLVGDIDGTIVGGTGRFANATGSFTFSLVFDTVTVSSTAEINGAIQFAGK